MSSELLLLRREVLQLRGKADRVRFLEGQNAMLHLAVSRLEQENITLKDAVVILQRTLREHDNRVLLQASKIAECERRAAASSSSPSLTQELPMTSSSLPSTMGSSPPTLITSRDHSYRRSSQSPTLIYSDARSTFLSNTQVRSTSRSPSPPHLHVIRHSNFRNSNSSSPMASMPCGGGDEGALSPLLSLAARHRDAVDEANDSSDRHRHVSLLHTPPRALDGPLLSRSPLPRSTEARRTSARALMDTSDIEVSAISSLFSPLSAVLKQSPMSPRRGYIPAPTPRTVAGLGLLSPRSANVSARGGAAVRATQQRLFMPASAEPGDMGSSTGMSTRRHSAIPRAPSRLAAEAASGAHAGVAGVPSLAKPPLPSSHSGKQQQLVQHPSRTPSPLSRSSTSRSLNLSIDEEINEGIQSKLASLVFC